MAFINEDFLLTTPAARELYHRHAEKMPIIDYHCHLPCDEIARDQRWENIAEVWLGGDHYKWRQMRTCGFSEELCSGKGEGRASSNWARFEAYAKTLECLVMNPLYDWSHLELARYFGVNECLGEKTAKRIYEKCNKALTKKDFSAQGLIKKSRVKVICTTDDPTDDLKHHSAIAKNPFGTLVLPTWRSDKASQIDNLRAWNSWVDALAKAAKIEIRSYDDFLNAMQARHKFFEKKGCVLSDYGTTEIFATPYTESEIAKIFKRARENKKLTLEEVAKFKSAWLFEGLKADAKTNWTTQIHFNCQRNINTSKFQSLGADAGFDVIGDCRAGKEIARLFDRLEQIDMLPRCIIYSLNPGDFELLATIMGSFQKGPTKSKIQLGSAWWFLDQKFGIRKHLETLGALGALGCFVGMLTDSRSFLSYTRHEYFRRLLCQKLGEQVANGELPNDLKWLGRIVEDISFNNANSYFRFNV